MKHISLDLLQNGENQTGDEEDENIEEEQRFVFMCFVINFVQFDQMWLWVSNTMLKSRERLHQEWLERERIAQEEFRLKREREEAAQKRKEEEEVSSHT